MNLYGRLKLSFQMRRSSEVDLWDQLEVTDLQHMTFLRMKCETSAPSSTSSLLQGFLVVPSECFVLLLCFLSSLLVHCLCHIGFVFVV